MTWKKPDFNYSTEHVDPERNHIGAWKRQGGASGGSLALPTPGRWVLPSTAVRKHISVGLSHQVCGDLSQHLQGMTTWRFHGKND